MTNNVSGWSRLEQVIRWTGMNTNQFARQIGLSRPDNIYHIKAGKIGLSQNLVRRIVETYPEISLGWLLAGEGSMLAANTGADIPYFECDVASAIVMNEKYMSPTQFLKIPFLEECDYACRSYDMAMMPEIMPGTIVFLKKTDLTALIPGGIYAVVTANFILLRRVRVVNGENSKTLILEASADGYDKVEIQESGLLAMYRLVGTFKMC